jgi:hypothetical protein
MEKTVLCKDDVHETSEFSDNKRIVATEIDSSEADWRGLNQGFGSARTGMLAKQKDEGMETKSIPELNSDEIE